MKKTDLGKILYPESLSIADRRHCRRMIVAVRDELWCNHAIVSCSAGIDSTVLVHALGQATRINPMRSIPTGSSLPEVRSDLALLEENKIKTTAVYLNHHLRPNEVSKEAEHVEKITKESLSYVTPTIDLDIEKGLSLQERARDARYKALEKLALKIPTDQKLYYTVNIFTAHNMNDVAETKLFQFIKGRKVNGIPKKRLISKYLSDRTIFLVRPFIKFSREDIERYARCFNLSWCEDSSNDSDFYTRNKIRHHLIPWIKENINPGIINTLGRDELNE